jgi:cytochrome c oxidase subunit 2
MAAQPMPWEMGLQPAASPIAEKIGSLHNLLLIIITAITLFVLGLLVYIVLRFNEKANPVPSKVTHNAILEVAWTVIPILILVVVAIPSFKLLYEEAEIPPPALTVKVTGHQWYWSYEYPDNGGFAFDSYMVKPEDLKPGQPKLLATDNAMVVPAGKVVRIVTTATDVIHAFFIPSFGVNVNAMPGRLNEVWFKVNEPGTYYGQCAKICGFDHAYMPIEVRALSEQDFAAWEQSAKKQFGAIDTPSVTKLAAIDTAAQR